MITYLFLFSISFMKSSIFIISFISIFELLIFTMILRNTGRKAKSTATNLPLEQGNVVATSANTSSSSSSESVVVAPPPQESLSASDYLNSILDHEESNKQNDNSLQTVTHQKPYERKQLAHVNSFVNVLKTYGEFICMFKKHNLIAIILFTHLVLFQVLNGLRF